MSGFGVANFQLLHPLQQVADVWTELARRGANPEIQVYNTLYRLSTCSRISGKMRGELV